MDLTRPARLARLGAALGLVAVILSAPAAPAAAQAPAGQQGLAETLRQRIQQSGLTADQIRARLRAAGLPETAIDAYLTPAPAGQQVQAPSSEVLRAATAAGLGDFGLDTLSALRREVVLSAGDSILLDSLGLVPGRDSIPSRLDATTGAPRLDTAGAVRYASWLRRPRVFGLDIFRRTTSQFAPLAAGPVDAEYRLGPGDELVLILTGDVDVVHQLPVTREGFVVIPQVGQISVANLTLDQLRTLLYTRLGRVYSGVRRGPGATIRFEVTVSRVRVNQVFVNGEVARPGSYAVSALGTVMSALYLAGGPTEAGNFRQVRVLRRGQMVRTLDLYDYLVRGNTRDDVRLETGDVIFVPPRARRVLVTGSVLRPGFYDLAASEDLREVLEYAGGLLPEADRGRAHVERILPPSQREPGGRDRAALDVPDLSAVLEPSAIRRFRLEPDDRITVYPVTEPVRGRVSIEGNVWRPGPYSVRPGTTLSRLLGEAGGLKPDSYRERAHIVRLLPDSTRRLIAVDLRPLVDAEGRAREGAGPGADPELMEFDEVTVFAATGFRPSRQVTVHGSVQRPGAFAFRDSMTLRDLVILAGGLRDDAYLMEAEIARIPEAPQGNAELARVLRVPLDSSYVLDATGYVRRETSPRGENPVLQPFDNVFIRRVPGFELQRTVVVTGQVRFPGRYALTRRDERLADVLRRAGGVTENAYVRGAQFFRSEGRSGRMGIDLERVLRDARHRDNLPLFAGDSIHLPEYQPVVIVEGAVNSPVAVSYESGRGTGYYVERAGGFASRADKRRTYVVQPNGSVYTRRTDPEPGARVVVPEVPAGAPRTDWVQLLTSLGQVLTSAVTLAILARQL